MEIVESASLDEEKLVLISHKELSMIMSIIGQHSFNQLEAQHGCNRERSRELEQLWIEFNGLGV